MIELVSESRCILCNTCVQVCPMNVFSAVKGAPPVVARKDDCQTCFMCELYCPADALYVAPQAENQAAVSEAAVVANGLLGSYREVAWMPAAQQEKAGDQTFRLYEPH
jgi:NAD-dependent dihydropyrimidine dehydrogenase PreA subunit